MKKQNKILLVDDQAFIRHIISLELSKLNYIVLTAENGQKAFALAIETNPDLILMDIMMPVMNGFECCQKIRSHERTKNIPVIFLSANNQKNSVVKAVQAGGNDFVVKSPNSSVLIEKIDKLLSKTDPDQSNTEEADGEQGKEEEIKNSDEKKDSSTQDNQNPKEEVKK